MEQGLKNSQVFFRQQNDISHWKINYCNAQQLQLSYSNKKIYLSKPPIIGSKTDITIFFHFRNQLYRINMNTFNESVLQKILSRINANASQIIEKESDPDEKFFFVEESNDNKLDLVPSSVKKMFFDRDITKTKNIIFNIYDNLNFSQEVQKNIKNIFISLDIKLLTESILNYRNFLLSQQKCRIELLIKIFFNDSLNTYVYNFSSLPTKSKILEIVKELKQQYSSATVQELPSKKIEYCYLAPRAVNYIITNFFIEVLNGHRIIDKQSCLSLDDIGNRKISNITIIDDCSNKKGLKSTLFDFEGRVVTPTFLFKDGLFLSPLLDYDMTNLLRQAYNIPKKKAGIVNENGELTFSNLVFKGSNKSISEMVNSINEIIWIDELTGFNFNYKEGSFVFKSHMTFYINKGRKVRIKDILVGGNMINIFQNKNTFFLKEEQVENNYMPGILTKELSLEKV